MRMTFRVPVFLCGLGVESALKVFYTVFVTGILVSLAFSELGYSLLCVQDGSAWLDIALVALFTYPSSQSLSCLFFFFGVFGCAMIQVSRCWLLVRVDTTTLRVMYLRHLPVCLLVRLPFVSWH